MIRTAPPARRPAGFTLTEVMIALAMTAFLLIGISKIFALTSTTISSGQALAKAMRSQRAIQQALSNDFLGSGPDIGSSTYSSGMLPFNNSVDAGYASPFLAISSSRVATYASAAAMAADTVQPTDVTVMNTANFVARSRAIRGIDLDKNGTETATSISSGGETTPLFIYGDRNFRTDTLSMFTHGRFQSQTGSANYVDSVRSNEAWVWYGHLRAFDGDAAALNDSNGFGPPGDWLTPTSAAFPTGAPNRNNRFSDQFRLGRFAFLLIEPIDHKYQQNNRAQSSLQDYATVVADNDPSKPIYFVKRTWWDPVRTANTSIAPINVDSSVYLYSNTNNINETVRFDDKTVSTGSTSPDALTAAMCRCDIAGAGLKQLRARARYVQSYSAAWATSSALPIGWTQRFWVNPFPAKPFSSKGMSQRQQLLADSCSQFVVEFAGDFCTQDSIGALQTGNPSGANVPDGVVDFVIVNGVRQTRWYGMPRDVDGDGSISTIASAFVNSPDVIPIRDFQGGVVAPCEKIFPITPAPNNYNTVVDEPTSSVNGNATRYVCVWAPADVTPQTVAIGGVNKQLSTAPQLIRILTDIRDPDGKLKEALTQEYVFPVRVYGAIKPPTTP